MGSETPKPSPPLPPASPRGPRGVLEAPGRLTGRAELAVGLVLIAMAGLTFWLLRAPLSAALDRLLPFTRTAESTAGDPSDEGSSLLGGGDQGLGGSSEPSGSTAARPPRVVEPERPSWTLVEVSESLEQAGDAISILIEQGRGELGELEDPATASEARIERTRRIWTNWGRTWSNRVEVIGATLPPAEACAVHAAMKPACTTLRQVLATLDAVPATPSIESATGGLDEAATALDLLLDPPVEEPEEGDEGDGEDDAEGDSGEVSES
ncbi:MAG: hypothetical protein MI919_37595 [Holophagales bacterium]|nr:hypothetical protein [Holophagales bacterium]